MSASEQGHCKLEGRRNSMLEGWCSDRQDGKDGDEGEDKRAAARIGVDGYLEVVACAGWPRAPTSLWPRKMTGHP